ncbi:MAG: dicarboxylate/amino acid:cation symporter [Drouetiella hepatica Uher 2000/2452]|uniref:Dicarboxylate/amino acid:cation symporter n=1 Tax=Drouetiella hepatica Uher 2000/2452 TaxID=904376 RepID=A0A951QCZ1_9CYAN|nr:dicarboxylate/amino acid:cation symporter [Drouetiella hepatica Uher 2000/2452]
MALSPLQSLQFRPTLIWLRSPWAIVISIVLGVGIGTRQHNLAAWISPVGELYLGLLKMCVLPILLSAITTSVGRLMTTRGASIRRILLVFPVSLLLVSSFAVAMAAIAGPGRNLSTATLERLGVMVNQSGIDLEISLTGEAIAEPGLDFNSFLLSIIPDNIFNALSTGQTLKVLIFSIISGIALGLIQESNTCFEVLDSIYKTFNKLIQWLTFLLPFGLCSLLATQISKLGLNVLFSMINFVVISIATFMSIYIFSTFILWRRSHLSLGSVLSALREPTILAIATSSSLACLPSAITALSERLQFNRQTVNLVAPLATTLCRFGSVTYFALATLFVAQLYHKSLSIREVAIVIVGAILAGMATSGVTGILTLTMLDLVLHPLKLPLEAVLVLFIAIDPILDPFRTLCIVHTGMAATAIITDLESYPELSH